MSVSRWVVVAGIAATCLVVAVSWFRGVILVSPLGVGIVTHHRRGDFGLETSSRIGWFPYWVVGVACAAAMATLWLLVSWRDSAGR